jgi:hypothetical protein
VHTLSVGLCVGHEPRIIPAIYVKPFVKGQKNDYNDAWMGWLLAPALFAEQI